MRGCGRVAGEAAGPDGVPVRGGATAAADPLCGPKYLVLGPLELRRHGVPCTPTPRKLRALFALLLLHANQPVAAEFLIDELWGGRPPRSAPSALQMYVSGLRLVLDPGHRLAGGDARRHPVLRTSAAGYLLAVGPGELDLHVFRHRAARGRELLARGRRVAAGQTLRSALALWRGRPLGDLGRSGLPPYYAQRLTEERLAVQRDLRATLSGASSSASAAAWAEPQESAGA